MIVSIQHNYAKEFTTDERTKIKSFALLYSEPHIFIIRKIGENLFINPPNVYIVESVNSLGMSSAIVTNEEGHTVNIPASSIACIILDTNAWPI